MATGPFRKTSNVTGAASGFYKMSYRSGRDTNGALVLETNPFIFSRTTIKNNRSWMPPLGTDGLAYYYNDPKTAIDSKIPTLYAHAYDRFAEKVWGDAQLLLAVDFFERGQTLKMLEDTLKRLLRAVNLVRKRRFRQAMHALRATPPGKGFSPSKEFFANWMALRYGWIPTLSSIYSLCEVLANPVIDKNGKRLSASAKATYTHVEWDTYKPGKRRWTNAWDARVRLSGRVVISDPRLAGLNQYGLLNPFSTAWELVSKSFVVGWFLPIGDILADLTRFTGVQFKEATVSYSISGRDAFYIYGTPTLEYTSVLKQRVVFTGVPPLPNRWVLGNGLNPKRCMDALALITGALRR